MAEVGGSLGFGVIVALYASVGVLAALGSIALTARLLAPRREQLFYGLFLVAIAAFYLAFAAYFRAASSWPLEMAAVGLFAVLGLFGTRLPLALFLGYGLHGVWDLLHEWHAHAGALLVAPEQLTPIPLGYGFFCLAFDIAMATYFVGRKSDWIEDRQARRAAGASPEPG